MQKCSLVYLFCLKAPNFNLQSKHFFFENKPPIRQRNGNEQQFIQNQDTKVTNVTQMCSYD